MTQANLARAVGMPQPSIARIENGSVTPRTATLIAILRATGHQLAVEPIDQAVDLDAIQRLTRMSVPRRVRGALGKTAGDPATGPIWIIRRLGLSGLALVLLGELAEVAHGRPGRVGRVIEICHPSTGLAHERLAAALRDLDATASRKGEYRTPGGLLRIRTSTPAGDGYDVVKRNAVRMPINSGMHAFVAGIDDLVRDRLATNTPEDRQVVAVLRRMGR